MPTISTVRPHAKPSRPVLAAEDRLISDNPATGVAGTRWADFLNQLYGLVPARTERNVANGYAGIAPDGFIDPSVLRAALVPEEVASDAARDALVIVANDLGRRLVRVTASGNLFLARATGSGADKWIQFNNLPSATTGLAGVASLATNAEAIAGTNTAKIMTPAANKAALDSKVDPLVATRAAGGYIWSDGATAIRAIVHTPGARGNLAGAAQASWVGWVDVPSSNAVTVFIASIGASSVGDNNGAYSLNLCINSGGTLEINAIGVSGFSNRRVFQWLLFRATYSGQRVWLEVRLSKGTSNPVIRVNGADVSSSFSQATAGTPPEWLDAALVSTFHAVGGWWPAGIAPLGCWLNTHLSDSESEAWRLTGRPPAWVVQGGSVIEQVPSGAFLNGQFETFTGATATGFNAVNTTSVGNASAPFAVQRGQRLRIRYTLTVNSGSVPTIGIQGEPTSNFLALSPGTNLILDLPPAGVGANANPRIEVLIFAATDFAITIHGISLIGALSLPGVQPIAVLDDVTSIGGNQARLVGMVPVCERRDWRIVARTSTNGNEQLLGGAVFAEPERHRIDSWVVNNVGAATRTVSLGQSSAATTYANAASCPVGRTEIALATRFPAAAQPNFWANSNGTDVLIHTITGHRVGSN